MTQLALREDIDGVAIVTFNRPEKLNAINREMWDVLFQAIDDLRDNDDLRVLLIKAKGRYFSAGVDIGGMNAAGPEAAESPRRESGIETRRGYRTSLHVHFDEMEAIEKPIVVAVQGPCLGGALEMAGSADFRLAGKSAAFGLPEIDIGVIAGSGGTSRITRLVGPAWSKWFSVAGEKVDSQTALMMGLVQAVYPDDELEKRVWEFCQRLMSRPREVQGLAKLAVELCWDLDRQQARHVERIANTMLMQSDEHKELVQAFLNRKK